MNSEAANLQPDTVGSYDQDLEWILEKLIARVGGSAGSILRRLANDGGPRVLAVASDPDASPAERGHAIEAARAALAAGRPAGPALTQGVVDHGTESSRLLMLWFQPAEGVVLLASVRRAGSIRPFSMLEWMVAERVVPVLERYVRLWWLHRTERRRADAFSAALDLSDVGVALLNRRAEVIFTNNVANLLLSGGRSTTQPRFLTAPDGNDALRLQAAVQHAVIVNQEGNGRSGEAARAPTLAMARPGGQRPLILTILSVQRPAVDPEDPVAIVYILDPQQDVKHLLAPACRIYRLTDAERRLVMHLVGGLTLLEAAAEMRVAPATARSYLKQVFDKTETKRQTDLVRLMLSSVMRTNVGADMTLM